MESIELKLPKRKTLVIDTLRFDSSHDFQLTEQDQDMANQELHEREDNKYLCLQKLKERLACIKGMRCRTDDAYLLRYLRWAKYDCGKACKAIKNLYSLRNKYPELYILPSNVYNLMKNYPATYMPYKDDEGRIIFWMDFRKWNLDEMSVNSLFVATNAMADIISMNPHMQVKGSLGIWDCRGVTVQHASLVTHTMKLWLMSNLIQDCYPWRIQQIVGIHCTPIIRTLYNLIRVFIKKKNADRIKLLGSDMTELHQYVNPAVLPKEYGGTLEESDCRITDIITDNLSYLEYERSFGFQISS